MKCMRKETMMGFEDLKSKLAKLGEDTVNTMQKMSENVQLSGKLSSEKKALDGLFAQLGAAVFDKLQDSPLEGLEDQFEAIRSAKSVIAGLEEQVQKLKGTVTCPECGREADKSETFCSACGAKLPEPAPEPEKTDEKTEGVDEDAAGAAAEGCSEGAQKVKKDAAEVGREVGDFINDAAEKAKGFFGSVADKAGAFIDGVASQIQKDKDAGEAADGAEPQEGAEAAIDETTAAAQEAVQEAEQEAMQEEAQEAMQEAEDEKPEEKPADAPDAEA